ncbi:hypothetical protein B0H12DRAFT_1061867 [Mycena haematopus]|nr:hypothetical protein B0H12DRAFT_1061867 [Mycena haematopus]
MSEVESELRPPQKRPRTEPESGPITYKRSEKVWMTYGDIILQVKNMQFRVNRDVLARNSIAFNGMFSIPQPIDETKVEGCSVVPLHGDSVKDVELFLSAFYNPFFFAIKQEFDVIACSLRLGRKYEAPAFKNDAVYRLHVEFPNTLSAWDKRQARHRLNGLEYIRPTPTILVDLLNLAYENGVYTCIPALAFRCLSLYSLSQLFAGFEREDRSRATLPDATKLTLACALEAIQIFQRNNFEWLREEGEVVPNQEECLDYDMCEAHRQEMYRFRDCGPQKVDITYTLEQWDKVGDWAGRLCKDCEKVSKIEHEAGRRNAWDRLPTFFGLPEWADLKDMD